MLTVREYPKEKPEEGHFSLELPQGAEILKAEQTRYGGYKLIIQALVNTENFLETRNFLFIRTGTPIEEDGKILSSIQLTASIGINTRYLFELRQKQSSS